MMWHYAGTRSLWADDLATIGYVAKGQTLQTIYQRILSDTMYNAPLFYILAFFWLRIMPYGTAYLKLFNILLCCLGVWFCGTAAQKLRGDRAAVIATIFAATSTFMVNYVAYTFRCYGLVFVLCSLLILAYLKRLNEPAKASVQVGYGILLALLLYTHYLSVLVIAALGLCDCWQFVRRKITWHFILPYVGAGLIFLPLMLFVVKSLIASHGTFWPKVPTLKSLISVTKQVFGNRDILFLLTPVTVLLLLLWKKYPDSPQRPSAHRMMWVMAICLGFVITVDFVYSRYINPSGSLFVVRYFTCVLPAATVLPAVGADWILEAICSGKTGPAKDILALSLIGLCYFSMADQQINALVNLDGTAKEPYEQAIDWIYSHDDARADDTLVMMTGYPDGFYYYATHDGAREGLPFGGLTQDNWQQYKVIYASPMHGGFTEEETDLLEGHYEKIGQSKYLKVTVYAQIGS